MGRANLPVSRFVAKQRLGRSLALPELRIFESGRLHAPSVKIRVHPWLKFLPAGTAISVTESLHFPPLTGRQALRNLPPPYTQ